MTLLSHSRVSTAVSAAMLLTALAPSASRAAESCRLEVPAELAPAWRHAAAALPALSSEECAQLRFEPAEAGVRLTFVTLDGSSAQRQLGEPSEVAPAVAALRVVGLPPMAAAEPEPEPSAVPSAREEADEAASSNRLLLVLASGARGGQSSLMSPLVSGSAALALGAWELGVTIAFDLRYFDLERRVRPSRRPGTFGAGALLGRREPLGNVTLLWGARAALAVLTSQSSAWSGPADSVEASELEGSPLEGRFGAYVGLSLPAAQSLRVRTELGGDLVAAGRARSSPAEDAAAHVPFTPDWALNVTVGLELAP